MVEIARLAEVRGWFDRARRTLEDAILQAQRVNAPEATATAAGELGRLLAQLGDLDAAALQLDRAAAAWEAADDPDGVISALHAKAAVEVQRLRPEEQRALLERAWAVEGASARLRADAGLRCGWALLGAARHTDALRVLEAVPPLLDKVGDATTAAYLRGVVDELRGWPTEGVGLAFALRRCGDERAAEELLQRARKDASAVGDMQGAVTARAALYLMYTTRADLAAAAAEMEAARKEARGVAGLFGQLRRLEGKVRAAVFGASSAMLD
jgi:tetratricopeptide (TPR) repeat protein